MKTVLIALLCVLGLLGPTPAVADVTLFLCEPYGKLGRLSPTGHTALYFDRVCAASPTVLRPCEPGETGVVISRYGGVSGVDWIAIPLIPYLYAVDRAADVPASADRQRVATLREEYRRLHLQSLVPDGPGGQAPKGNWVQLIGAAYNRRIVAFTVATTIEQDARLIRTLNGRPNKSRFNFFVSNCADFARDLINLYFPKAAGRNVIADFGLTTPKHVAKSVVKYSEAHPDLALRTFVISQIPGNQSQTGAARGVTESLVRKAIYVVPLALVQPWIPVACAGGYIIAGRFNTKQNSADVYDPAQVERWAGGAFQPREVHRGAGQPTGRSPR